MFLVYLLNMRYVISENRYVDFIKNYIRKDLSHSHSEYDDDGYVFYMIDRENIFTVDDTTNQILIDEEFYHRIQRGFNLDEESLNVILKDIIDDFLNGDYTYNFPYGYEHS